MRTRGQKKRIKVLSDEEDNNDTKIVSPPRTQTKKRRKTTPVHGREFRVAKKTRIPRSIGRQMNVKVKCKRKKGSRPAKEEPEEQEDIRADEQKRDAAEDTPVLAEPEEVFFQPVIEAMERARRSTTRST